MKKIIIPALLILASGCATTGTTDTPAAKYPEAPGTYSVYQDNGTFYVARSPKPDCGDPKSGTTAGPSSCSGKASSVAFPKGTLFGGASSAQVKALAGILADSHNCLMQEMATIEGDVKGAEKHLGQEIQKSFADTKGQLGDLDKEIKKIPTACQAKNEVLIKKMDETFQELQRLSRQSGTGEVTVFFPVKEHALHEGSPEHTRLVNFLDYLARESKGRKVLLVVIGSASIPGSPEYNLDLSTKRAEFAAKAADTYLINVPHETFKVYGVGEAYSKKGRENRKYQQARVIAIYDTDQLPQIPEQATKPVQSAGKATEIPGAAAKGEAPQVAVLD
ncbi:MAG: hypothetical protein WC291_00590 [Thermodesulfovibrionales bacterium]